MVKIDLWEKRDNVARQSFGWNKTRQLDFYLGVAFNQNRDTNLITRQVHSVLVRTAAALAAKIGMREIVQLETGVPSGNAQRRFAHMSFRPHLDTHALVPWVMLMPPLRSWIKNHTLILRWHLAVALPTLDC